LYHRHRDFALRIAWRYSTTDADALDAVQSAFVYLAGKLTPGVSPPFVLTAKLSTFLFPVVKHEALALRRKGARMKLGADIGNEAAASAVVDELPARDAPPDADRSARRVASAIKSLPPAQREVILLRFIDNLSMEEISAVLAIPAGTVKSRLHNAMKALAEDAEAVGALVEGK
jgi:RNA polymerase sigma-70 factor (ECF subfamily)